MRAGVAAGIAWYLWAAMEPTGERSDEHGGPARGGAASLAAMEPTGERSDEPGVKFPPRLLRVPQWSRPASGRMRGPTCRRAARLCDAAMEPTGERSDEVKKCRSTARPSVAAMEPTGERSDEEEDQPEQGQQDDAAMEPTGER